MNLEEVQKLLEVTQFIYKEARLQDDHQYADWEALWTDDGVYWIPANGEDIDPDRQMSIIYDNRSRIALRVAQLYTGKRHTQLPRSRLRRVVSNVEIVEESGDNLKVISNAIVFESNTRGETVWASKNEYMLRRVDGQLRMSKKTVVLVNNDAALFSLSFLI